MVHSGAVCWKCEDLACVEPPREKATNPPRLFFPPLSSQQMSLSLNFENANDKNQLVAGLATLLAKDCGNCTAEAINAAAKTSGTTLPAGYAAVYASFAAKHDTKKLCPALGGGGGAAAAAAPAAAAAAPAAKAEKPKEEEVDALDGGMNMFGGGGGGGGDY